jgi:hypothetical protein
VDGHIECTRLLLGAGASVDLATTDDGSTPLYIACRGGHVECTRLLLDAGASVDLATTDNGETPLYIACWKGHVECVRLLLGAGASLDLVTTDDGSTPLFIACWEGRIECIRLLLDAGASVNLATTDDGSLPIFIAFHEGHFEIVQLLSSYGASRIDFYPLALVALPSTYPNHAVLIKWLIVSRHWTPLHHLEVLSPERARALLRAGAGLHLKPKPEVPSPLERAQQLLSTKSASSSAASLIVRAAGPWAVESHELFANAERALAATLVRSLYHVYLRRMCNGGWQAVDFARGVLPFVIVRGMAP